VEEMLRRALKGTEKVLGVDHPETLTALTNLALMLRDQGKYEEAEEMNRRALKGEERVLGVEHPYTLNTVANLASLLHAQGKHEEAERMNRRALKRHDPPADQISRSVRQRRTMCGGNDASSGTNYGRAG
jgi:tetratricopeptide (TPR) repeat protein